jgi:large subunit ribosomal protein L25
MSNTVIKVVKRDKDELKKNASRRLRAEGFIPATIYGQAAEPVSIKIDKKDFKELLKNRSISNLIFDMHFKDDGKEKKETTLIKDFQKDPISTDFLHIDFIRIQMKKEVETSVHISLLNEEEAIGVKEGGGVIQHGLRDLHIACLPADIPERITYDVKELEMGQSIKVSDITAGEGIRILNNPEEVIVSIIHPTHLVVEQPVAEVEAEGEEPEVIAKEKAAEKEE